MQEIRASVYLLLVQLAAPRKVQAALSDLLLHVLGVHPILVHVLKVRDQRLPGEAWQRDSRRGVQGDPCRGGVLPWGCPKQLLGDPP